MKDVLEVLVGIMVVGLAAGSLSASDSLRVHQLDEILVTATRLNLPIERLPISADVIERRRIEESDANSATDVVAGLAGVFLQRTGDFGRSDLNIRGLGSNGRRLTVLIDGHPVKMGIFGCTITHALPLNGVKRLELVRGPMSVLYGSDALGGVLNIVTDPAPAATNAEIRASVGTHDTRTYGVSHGADLGHLGYVVALDRRQSDGHLPNSAYEGNDFSGKLSVDAGRARMDFYAKYFDGHREEPALATEPPGTVSDVWNDYKRGTVDLGLTVRTVLGWATLKMYDEFGEHEFSDGWLSKDHSRGVMAHVTGRAEGVVEVNGGVEFRHQSGKRLSDPVGDWSKSEYASYVFLEAQVSDHLSGTGGLRVNHDEVSGNVVAPQFGLMVRPVAEVALNLNAARGFRSPQLSELYLFPSSNPDLDPEKIWSYEIGVTADVAGRGQMRLAAFKMVGDDFIEVTSRGNSPRRVMYRNTGEIEFRGLEAGFRLHAIDPVSGGVAYSYLDPGDRTVGRPGTKVDVDVRLKLGSNTVAGDLQFVTDYYAADNREAGIDDYIVVNARVARKVIPGLEASVSVKNILDEAYEIYTEIPGGSSGLYRMPGRRYRFGLKYDWPNG
jgi:outer membrane cobalamin receptor